jgi:hypothetical protein
MPGRKPFAPTDEQRRVVRALSGYGVPHDDIALIVKCSPPTLRKWFRQELDVGAAEATAKVAQTMFQQATSGTNTAAMIFWLKARAGWREKQVVEVTGKDGSDMPPSRVLIEVVGCPPTVDPERPKLAWDGTTARERSAANISVLQPGQLNRNDHRR